MRNERHWLQNPRLCQPLLKYVYILYDIGNEENDVVSKKNIIRTNSISINYNTIKLHPNYEPYQVVTRLFFKSVILGQRESNACGVGGHIVI